MRIPEENLIKKGFKIGEKEPANHNKFQFEIFLKEQLDSVDNGHQTGIKLHSSVQNLYEADKFLSNIFYRNYYIN